MEQFIVHAPGSMRTAFFAAYSEAAFWYTLGYAVFSINLTTHEATAWSIA